MKKSYLAGCLIILLVLTACSSGPKGQVTINSDTLPKTIQTFKETGDPICTNAEGKPIIRLFATSWCPHCKWIKKTYTETVEEYVEQGKVEAHLWEVDTNDDLLTKGKDPVPANELSIFKTYNPEGSIPTFVFGCKYFRIANGYEMQKNLAAEEAEFRLVMDDLLAPEETETQPMMEEVSTENQETMPSSSETKEFMITAEQFKFTPKTITVTKGDKVKLTVTSLDVSHGLKIPEFDVNVQVEKDETKSVEFVADKAGTFTFSCSVVCGSGHGDMQGTLIVNEA
jgi:cytochrome c oxidase subunit 2